MKQPPGRPEKSFGEIVVPRGGQASLIVVICESERRGWRWVMKVLVGEPQNH